MARRRLLGDEQWATLFALPAGERDVVRHCTLTSDDHTLVAAKRSATNRLGYALLLCALRHPGRALEPGEKPPAPMVTFVARQLGIDTAVLGTGCDRPQTRREQLAELMRCGGFQGFGRAEARDLIAWLTPVTQVNRKPGQLAVLLVEELRPRPGCWSW
jgi:TnpA family transposase